LSQSGRNTKLEISAFQSIHLISKHVQNDLIAIPFFDTASVGLDSLFNENSMNSGVYNIAASHPHETTSNFAVINGGAALSDLKSFQSLKNS